MHALISTGRLRKSVIVAGAVDNSGAIDVADAADNLDVRSISNVVTDADDLKMGDVAEPMMCLSRSDDKWSHLPDSTRTCRSWILQAHNKRHDLL